jgi:hypothetical protein
LSTRISGDRPKLSRPKPDRQLLRRTAPFKSMTLPRR